MARLELHARGCHCPRGFSPSESAGICFRDATPQLPLPASHITAATCLRCIAGTGLEQGREPRESLRHADMGRRDPLHRGDDVLVAWVDVTPPGHIKFFDAEAASGGTRHQAVASGECFFA